MPEIEAFCHGCGVPLGVKPNVKYYRKQIAKYVWKNEPTGIDVVLCRKCESEPDKRLRGFRHAEKAGRAVELFLGANIKWV